MKLKFELVNGYGILVDQEAEITKNGYHYNPRTKTATKNSKVGNNALIKYADCIEIIFAEPELKLEGVPVFEWRDFEPNEKSLLSMFYNTCKATYPLFDDWIEAKEYKKWLEKYNPAKYTENDLMILSNFIIEFYEYQMENKHFIDKYGFSVDKLDLSDAIYKLIQSLQKYPQYVVMESEEVIVGVTEDGSEYVTELNLKLYNNSEGKQQGTVNELIWK
jgi:hypothetical protein